MKNIFIVLLTFTCILILPACKKALESLLPNTDEPYTTPVGVETGHLVSKTIGANGGSIVSADGNAELIFPAGALIDNTTVGIQAITNNAPNGVGNGYRFLPEGIKFSQSVTVKFHYSENDLAATSADFMGIAFQDSIGAWYRLNTFTNDSSSKIISATITHFSDWTIFDLIKLSPGKASVRVNKTVELAVSYIESEDKNGDEPIALLLPQNPTINWSANGIPDGNSSAGTLTGSNENRTYTAPAKIPAGNPVAVSAEAPFSTKFHGKRFDKLLLVSYVKVIDDERYLLEIKETETTDPFVYTDTASLIVSVSADGLVTFSDISNYAPKSNPASATSGDCTATWIPDGTGEINITGATGEMTDLPGSDSRILNLHFTHTGAISPKFSQVCAGSSEVINGGVAMAGLPQILSFTLTPGPGIYLQDDGQEFIRLSLLE